VHETRRWLGPAGDLFEPVRGTGWNRDVGILRAAVDHDLVIAIAARKAHDATPDFVLGDLVLGVAVIALESHRLRWLWAGGPPGAACSFGITRILARTGNYFQ
jgi:hypothetical protein